MADAQRQGDGRAGNRADRRWSRSREEALHPEAVAQLVEVAGADEHEDERRSKCDHGGDQGAEHLLSQTLIKQGEVIPTSWRFSPELKKL